MLFFISFHEVVGLKVAYVIFYFVTLYRYLIYNIIKNTIETMSKLGSILLGVVAGTAAGVGVVLLLDKEKNLCKKNSISDKVDDLKDQFDSFTRNLRDKTMELKGTLEEKVDHLFSDSDSKPEDLIKLLEKKLASLKEKAKK